MSHTAIDGRPIDEIAAEIAHIASLIEVGTRRAAPGSTVGEASFISRVVRGVARAPFDDRDLLGLENALGIIEATTGSEVIGETYRPGDSCNLDGDPDYWIVVPVHSDRGRALLDLAGRMHRFLDLRRQFDSMRVAEQHLRTL